MFLAPMIGVMEACILLEDKPYPVGSWQNKCTNGNGSAAALIESTLLELHPDSAVKPPYALGYTLPIPLLQLFRKTAGQWSIDQTVVSRLVRTVKDMDRPAVLYFFSTHFGSGNDLERELGADPANLAYTQDGPLHSDTYYGSAIHNWTFATTQTPVTAKRIQAAKAVIAEICRLEPADKAKIKAVTLLGELHHLFPDFESGMGFRQPYRITDYRPESVAGFQRFLRQHFRDVKELNKSINASYPSFEAVQPPSRDIRKEHLSQFTEHIDAYAHGSLPITGWAHIRQAGNAGPAWVHVFRNGEFIGKRPVSLGRQDVLQALPELGDANTGWQLDMDFRSLPPGEYRIDVMLEGRDTPLMHIGTRTILIQARDGRPPAALPQKPLPASSPPTTQTRSHVDQPLDRANYYYNPLVLLWHAFRAQQVTEYIRFFDQVFEDSCLAGTARYTHQIIPFTNAGWDVTKFAIEPSLLNTTPVRLGVSLYGEPTYGNSFIDWYARTPRKRYGVTEFHPLKNMDNRALRKALDMHASHGADFLSFFLEPRWDGELVPRKHNIFSLAPENHQSGSDGLYRSMQEVLNGGGAEK